MADVAENISKLGDEIANLKLIDAVALRDYLKEKYKIEPAAGGGMMMAAPTGPATTAEEQGGHAAFPLAVQAVLG